MILFRSTRVTGTMLQAMSLLCIFSSITSGKWLPLSLSRSSPLTRRWFFIVSAVPQFGRPQMRVLDEESSVPSSVEPTGAVNDVRTHPCATSRRGRTKTRDAHAPTLDIDAVDRLHSEQRRVTRSGWRRPYAHRARVERRRLGRLSRVLSLARALVDAFR